MALEKKTVIGEQIEIVGDYKILQIRDAVQILEDNNVISQEYHRRSLNPSDDISDESDEIKAIANAVWTDQLKADYKAFSEKQIADREAMNTEESSE